MRLTVFICALLICHYGSAQDRSGSGTDDNEADASYNASFGEIIRGANAASFGVGSSVLNGDLEDPLFEIYFHVGYKRFITPHLNINLSYHKFNLAYKDQFNEGFMSFDLNLEFNVFPDRVISPFIFAGGGYHAANYFESTLTKIQGGAGIEYMFLPRLGLKLFADYNHVFDDELDGKIFGDSDDIYWRMGMGVNIYFGRFGKGNQIDEGTPTIMGSNPIIDGKE